ncbi:MAG TPA: serine hydrolase [Acidobacteriota bacterium]|nr:serine hydrolase [Acidobacteriota bacterium]
MKKTLAMLLLLGVAAVAFAQEEADFPPVTSLEELKKIAEETAAGIEGRVGVYVLHVESGEEFGIAESEYFGLASVFKVPLLVTLFKAIDEGYYSLDDRLVLTERMKTYGSGLLGAMKAGLNPSINDVQLLMMAVSDNTATDILFDLVGPERIAAYMAELGLTKTVVDLDTRKLILGYLGLDMDSELTREELGRVPEEYWMGAERQERMKQFDSELHDVSTPYEIGQIWAKMVRGEIVDRETSDTVMATCRHHTGARLITRYMPFGVSVARKGGSLGRDGRDTVLNDSGIIFMPDKAGHVVVCVFGNDLFSEGWKFEVAAGKISRAAYDYFHGKYKQDD